MSEMKPRPDRRGQWLKNIGLTGLCTGFALELGGIAINDQPLLKTGLILFLAGIPLTILGVILNRRSR